MAFNIRTIATTLLLPFAVAASSHADSEEAQRSDFQFSVSGALAGRLEPGTRIFIWNPMPGTERKWLDFSVDDLPVTVPYERLAKGYWIASFVSRTPNRGTIFSIHLDRKLFDRPRKISIKLDQPRPSVRPSLSHPLQFHYCAHITRRMHYWDLPSWDEESQAIVAAKPPVLRITRISDGVTLQEGEMEAGCMGSKWWAWVDRSLDLGKKTRLQITVRYDSGGLWDPIETHFDYQETP